MNSRLTLYLIISICILSACSPQKQIQHLGVNYVQIKVENQDNVDTYAILTETNEKQPSAQEPNQNERSVKSANAQYQVDLEKSSNAMHEVLNITNSASLPFTAYIATDTLQPQPVQPPLKLASESLGFGIAGLILSFLGLIPLSITFAILAIIKGNSAKKIFAENPGMYSNESKADLGFVFGILGLVISILYLILIIAFIFAFFGFAFQGIFGL